MWMLCVSYHEWKSGVTLARTADLSVLKKGPFPSPEVTLLNLTTVPSLALFKEQTSKIDDFSTESNLLLPHSGKCISFNGEYSHRSAKKPTKVHFNCSQVYPFVSSAILCYNRNLVTNSNPKKGTLRKLEMMAQATVTGYDAQKDRLTVVPYCFTSTNEETEMVLRVLLRYRFVRLVLEGLGIGIGMALMIENWETLGKWAEMAKEKVGWEGSEKPARRVGG